MYPMKGGVQVTDRRLGRIPSFDTRSLDYPIRLLVATETPRSYTWHCGVNLDQGSTPQCVGFSWTQELAARPVVEKNVDDLTAHLIYGEAQKIDEWPGEGYDGTSVLAGAKVVTTLGYMREYRWAFGLDDLVLAVGRHGPAVLGINWYESMFTPSADGLLTVAGSIAGGHAILCNGVDIKRKRFRLHNSWGVAWGIKGEAFLAFDDMARLFSESGEACVPVKRLQIVR